MGMMYTASFENVTVSGAQDFFFMTAAATSVVLIHSCYIGQASDYGDAQAEGLRIRITRRSTAGSGGSGATIAPHQVGLAAAETTVTVNRTTPGTATTQLHADAFNIQTGWQYRPTPEERLVISPSGLLGIELMAAPTDPLQVSGSVVFEEIGGA